jgi:hypothetical protein
MTADKLTPKPTRPSNGGIDRVARQFLADKALDEWPQRTAVSLTLPEDLSFDYWKRIGQKLNSASSSLRWYIGDWLLHGERMWGEMYADAEQITGLSYDTLAHCKSVASKFEPWRRRQKLRWGDHREVAALTVENQDRLLDGLISDKWSRERLRIEVSASRAAEVAAKREAEQAALTADERAELDGRSPLQTIKEAVYTMLRPTVSPGIMAAPPVTPPQTIAETAPQQRQPAPQASNTSQTDKLPIGQTLETFRRPLVIDVTPSDTSVSKPLYQSFEEKLAEFVEWYKGLTITQQSRVCEIIDK